ncbi:hypothetical protein [Nocardia vermiculata]|uniref:DUF8020 domain-containing protein n=1 Tax=Nocardia vermiculata TaxID=257274 RepID=A0A846Y5E6_9NOCA|nr:hypothetical protein [Nocardia vermiculata]NKY54433.1 hypothetical protein [Nocardia vermiculata]
MKLTKPALITALAVGAATVTAGTAHAESEPGGVHYEIGRQADSAVVSTSDGNWKVVADQLILSDLAGRPVAAVPLTFAIDDTAYPINARIDGNTATLTPDRSHGHPAQAPARGDVVSVQQAAESFTPRDSQALGAFGQRVAIGAGVSAVLGAVIGGGVGCLVGGAVGAAISSPVIMLLAPFVGATVAGCVLGAATLGAVGSMSGLILAGGPITLFSAIQYFSTILAPCSPELAYCKDPAQAMVSGK